MNYLIGSYFSTNSMKTLEGALAFPDGAQHPQAPPRYGPERVRIILGSCDNLVILSRKYEVRPMK